MEAFEVVLKRRYPSAYDNLPDPARIIVVARWFEKAVEVATNWRKDHYDIVSVKALGPKVVMENPRSS